MLAGQGAMRNVELIQNMKDVYSIAWENKKSIRKLGQSTTLRSSPSKSSQRFLKAAILVNPMISKAYGIDEQIKARKEKRK